MMETTHAHESEAKKSHLQPPTTSLGQVRKHSNKSSCSGCGTCRSITRSTNASASLMLKSLDPGKKVCATRFLQQNYGNRYVQRLILTKRDSPCLERCGGRTVQMKASGCCGGCGHQGDEEAPIQTRLKIGRPGDVHEQEADRVADRVMRMPEPQIRQKCSKCDEELLRQPEEEEEILAKELPGKASALSSDTETSIRNIKGGGQPLPESTRAFMEPRFGHDFSQVRIHKDSQADGLAGAVNAKAFTLKQDIVFKSGQYAPETTGGKRLLAHELTHVVQQDYALRRQVKPPTKQREYSSSSLVKVSKSTERIALKANRGNIHVSHVTVYLPEEYIDFHTSQGLYRYSLDQKGLQAGEYLATATKTTSKEGMPGVDFTLEAHSGEFYFTYKLEKGKPNPLSFFANQKKVTFTITGKNAPAIDSAKHKPVEPDDRDPSVKYLTIEEAMKRCQSGNLPGVKVFPYRGTRFGGAPIIAYRDGNEIVVKQHVYVLANKDFKKQTKTLPIRTFIGGVRLKPNEIVRVHTYEPRWYHLNITGSTSGDIEDEFCVTGSQMLEIAKQSDKAVLINIGLTVVDAVLFFVPVGKLGQMIGRPVMKLVGRGSRNMAMAFMLGLREASPTAFAGIASRATTVVVEEQVVGRAASKAVSQTISHATVEFSERTLTQAVPRAVGKGATKKLGTGALKEGLARTVVVTVVDKAGKAIVSSFTTPTGDAAVDAMIDLAFSKTFNQGAKQTASQSASQAAQKGVTTVAPEVAAGFTTAKVRGFKRFLAKPFSHADIKILEQLWDEAARAGDAALLNAGNSRYLFNLHRDRFWRKVINNPQAKAIFEAAGCKFKKGAPYYMLKGRRITMTIDHIIERQTSPHLALTASNLRLAFTRENTVVLRLLNQLDKFQ